MDPSAARTADLTESERHDGDRAVRVQEDRVRGR